MLCIKLQLQINNNKILKNVNFFFFPFVEIILIMSGNEIICEPHDALLLTILDNF